MAAKVKAIPSGYEGALPYLCVRDAAGALDFYKRAFGAEELMRFPMPDGKIGHAEFKIGKAIVMLADEFPEQGFHSPQKIGGSPVQIMVYVEDVDSVVKQAEEAGAKVLSPVADQFYGDRSGRLQDPYGHTWYLSTHKEDVAPEEMQKRHDEYLKKQAAK
jgi:PhnB protein